MISVVCPFYNESSIIEAAIGRMLNVLETIPEDWELIVVNDGSLDNSWDLARSFSHPRLKVAGYPVNRGRGFALQHGMVLANGDVIVTTEIDCSWGDDIVHRIVETLRSDSAVDMVIASPNLAGGGYYNVPRKRVLVSKIGNMLLRLTLNASLTMYTGMTRGYRREMILSLPLDEPEKEFHLEVARKALAFNWNIVEVPAKLVWRDSLLMASRSEKRKSSSNVKKLIRTHLLFSVIAAPAKYIFPISATSAIIATIFLTISVTNFLMGSPSAFYLLTSLLIYVFSLLVMIAAILTHQNISIQTELWRVRMELRKGEKRPVNDEVSLRK